jgi:hypothetical protein
MIHDRSEFLFGNRDPGIFHQSGVDPALGIAGFLDRMDFRPQVIGTEKVVRDPEAPGGIARQQAIPAVTPEIRQGR